MDEGVNQDGKQNGEDNDGDNDDIFPATLVFAFDVVLPHEFEVAGVGFEEEVEDLSDDRDGADGGIEQDVKAHEYHEFVAGAFSCQA